MSQENIENNIQPSRLCGIRSDILICLLLSLAIAFLYSPALDYGFTSYDDHVYITDNIRLHSGMTLKNIAWAFRTFHAANWHPVTWLSHMLDIELYGLNPGGHHAGNLLFHIANTLLLFLLLHRLTGRIWRSAVAAGFFALHPVHVESVVWIAERKDVLSGFFYLLTLWLYQRYAQHPTAAGYFGVVIVFSFGLMAKPMLVTLPFVLLLLDFWPLGRLNFIQESETDVRFGIKKQVKVISEKIPLLFLSAVSSMVTIIAQKTGGALITLDNISVAKRVSNALTSYANYLYKILWPFDLSIFYPYPEKLNFCEILGAGLLLVSVTIIALKNAGRFRWMTMGWFWYVGTLIPVIGLVQVGNQSMADRYTYIPSIGVFILIAWGIPWLLEQYRFKASLMAISSVLVLTFFFVNAGVQIHYWKNDSTLFRHATDVTTGNLMAHIHLGAALEKEGDRHQAIIQYQKGLRINPAYPKLHCYMANALLSEGRTEEAVRHYREVLSMVPHDASTHNNLGLALLQLGKIEEAESHFTLALKANPGYRNALGNQKVSIKIRRKIDTAAENFHRALLKFQESGQAEFEIKELHERKIELVAAFDHFRRALSRQPGFEPSRLIFDNISSVAAANRDYEKALVFFSKQSADSSTRPEGLYHSACIYARQKNTGKSLDALLDAVRSGFHDWKLIETDSDLNPIRENPVFQQLLTNRQAFPVQSRLLDNER